MATAIINKGPCVRCGGSGKDIDDKQTGARLAKRRLAAGLKQEQVAAIMGCTGSYVSDLELGKRNWTVQLVAKYEAALR